MLTLLGSLLGFLSAGLPKIFEFFQQKEDNKLKTQMLQMQIDAAKAGQEFDLKVFEVKKDFAEQQMLLQHDIAMQGNWLSSSVRPVITYLFFFIFATVKISMIVNAIHTGQDFNSAMMMTWDEETQAIFAAIISFWFGSRAMQKSKGK
jgi:hypothetical protein